MRLIDADQLILDILDDITKRPANAWERVGYEHCIKMINEAPTIRQTEPKVVMDAASLARLVAAIIQGGNEDANG